MLFAHWRVDPGAVAAALPPDLTVDTFDGSAWVSALAPENRSVPPALDGAVPQLNVRTYATRDGDTGVYFLSLDTGLGAAAATGSGAFGLPFRRARTRLTRTGDRITFRGRRAGSTPPAVC